MGEEGEQKTISEWEHEREIDPERHRDQERGNENSIFIFIKSAWIHVYQYLYNVLAIKIAIPHL